MPVNLVKRALGAVDEIYTSTARQAFLAQFESSPFASELSKPLLTGGSGNPVAATRLNELDLRDVSEISLTNQSTEPCSVELFVDMVGQENTVEGLFKRFVRCCSHTNHLGDFRTYQDYYSRVYAGQRYLAAHGDGHCVALALLFQSLCRQTLGTDVTLNYCYSENREFTHVFGTYIADDGRTIYTDPDQKTICDITVISGSLPDGFIFQMISQAGCKLHDLLVEDGFGWLFSSMTTENFSGHSDAGMAIFKEEPSRAEMTHVFAEARQHHVETMEIDEDDYPWKAEYRKLAKSDAKEQGAYFISRRESPWSISVPSGGRFEIGFVGNQFAQEIQDLFTVFFGRVPGTLWIDLTAGERVDVTLPEFPWFITTVADLSAIYIDGQELPLRTSACGAHRLAGMEHLEAIMTVAADQYDMSVEASMDCTIGIGLPVNAFALNSGFASLEASDTRISVAARA